MDRAGYRLNIAKDRNYEATFKGIHGEGIDEFRAYLESPLIPFFKKYAMRLYNTENIMFWMEAQDFRRGVYIRPAVGTYVSGSELLDPASARAMRAKRICDKYLVTDAKWEINVEDSMRKRVANKVDQGDFPIDQSDGTTCLVFDEPQKEIFKLLKENLWTKFKQGTMDDDQACQLYLESERKTSSTRLMAAL